MVGNGLGNALVMTGLCLCDHLFGFVLIYFRGHTMLLMRLYKVEKNAAFQGPCRVARPNETRPLFYPRPLHAECSHSTRWSEMAAAKAAGAADGYRCDPVNLALSSLGNRQYPTMSWLSVALPRVSIL